MRIDADNQARRLVLAEFKVDAIQLADERELTQIECLTALSELVTAAALGLLRDEQPPKGRPMPWKKQ